MTVLKLAKTVADQSGIPAIVELVNSTGETERLIRSLITEIGKEASEQYEWPVLTRIHSFLLEDGRESYPLPPDLNSQIAFTHWDRANYWMIYGPLSPREWQYVKSGIAISAPYTRFTVYNATDDQFYIDPIPGADEDGQEVAFSYQSKNWLRPPRWVASTNYDTDQYVFYNGVWYVVTSTGTTNSTPPSHTSGSAMNGTAELTVLDEPYDTVKTDADVPLLDQRVLSQGVQERYNEKKGFPFVPRYEFLLRQAFERTKPARAVHLSRRRHFPYPRIKETGHGF